MKRPASVITTLILFGLFILMGILTVVKNSPAELGSLLAGSAMPVLFLIGWIGVFLKKNWARIYSTVLIVLFGVLMLALPFINKAEQNQQNELIVLMLIMFAFLAWWAYSLCLGKPSKEHFQSSENA
jgi:NADH:ubiquinone oxidoreductase subunit K